LILKAKFHSFCKELENFWKVGVGFFGKSDILNDFQVITAFGHSAFITSQSLFVPKNMVLNQQMSTTQQ